MLVGIIKFPAFQGIRCLMMPYIQGDAASVPEEYRSYSDILNSTFIKAGDIGYLTIDESPVTAGKPHRGARAKHARALHTEAGVRKGVPGWGTGWGSSHEVTLNPATKILVANSIDNSCAVWDAWHPDTGFDGDIGDYADRYPYDTATLLQAGEVCEMGIFTPHESLPIQQSVNRQFLRIVGAGVYGREPYFTENPLFKSTV